MYIVYRHVIQKPIIRNAYIPLIYNACSPHFINKYRYIYTFLGLYTKFNELLFLNIYSMCKKNHFNRQVNSEFDEIFTIPFIYLYYIILLYILHLL